MRQKMATDTVFTFLKIVVDNIFVSQNRISQVVQEKDTLV